MAVSRNAVGNLIHDLTSGIVPQNQIPQVLFTIFNARESMDYMLLLPEQDLRIWVECLDQVSLV